MLKAAVDRLVRPGGLVICDLQQLALVEKKNGTEKERLLRTPVAAGRACQEQVERMSATAGQQAASLGVLSEMRVFLLLGSDLRARGIAIESDLIFDKENMYGGLATTVADKLRTRFPYKLKIRHARQSESGHGLLETHRVGKDDCGFISHCLDVVLWPVDGRGKVSGRAVTEKKGEYEYTSVPGDT